MKQLVASRSGGASPDSIPRMAGWQVPSVTVPADVTAYRGVHDMVARNECITHMRTSGSGRSTHPRNVSDDQGTPCGGDHRRDDVSTAGGIDAGSATSTVARSGPRAGSFHFSNLQPAHEATEPRPSMRGRVGEPRQ
jgi:hypothetical protein